ncbi:hypothetical protein [Methylopila sp. M107]|uniref:O-antigen ligase family protein n=1 Tax=Methylopila sp. M107 TaxID=1101190 RepID=UPI00037D4DD9|nr:hypothetical protein [Methylopila sp. M107]
MSDAGALQPSSQGRPLVFTVEGFRQGLVFVAILSSFYVQFEPAPYDILIVTAFALFAFTGLRLPRALVPFLLLVVLYQLGAVLTLTQVLDRENTARWTLIGAFLAVTGVFFAFYLAEDTDERARRIAKAWLIAGTIGGVLAIVGYFHLIPFSEKLLRYGRAMGAFKDPNVYAPWLVFPAVLLIQTIYSSTLKRTLLLMVPLGFIVAGVLLSFSRGAWGHLVASVIVMTALTVLVAPTAGRRARILVTCVAAAGAAIVLIVGMLQIPAVQKLMVQRASLEQSYDVGHGGRFANHTIGWRMALEEPLGIGIFQFAKKVGADVHNTYLNGFLSYGWLGGLSLLTLAVLTLAFGFRYVLSPTPWRPIFICTFSSWTILMVEAAVIDVDHWRHQWMLLGMMWGFFVATEAYERRRAIPGPGATARA